MLVEIAFLCVEIVVENSNYFLDLLSSDELSAITIGNGSVSFPE